MSEGGHAHRPAAARAQPSATAGAEASSARPLAVPPAYWAHYGVAPGPVQLKRALPSLSAPEGLAPADAPSSGAPLPSPVRAKMERSLGGDFADVRVHEGPQAEAMGAQAFARGNQLHFAPGRYDPSSRAGQELIGHELAHVQQQRGGQVAAPQGKGGVNADPSLEAEADRRGALAARGEPAPGGGGGVAGDGVAQLARDFTLLRDRFRYGAVNNEWRYVSADGYPHITVFPSPASQQWLRDEWDHHRLQAHVHANLIDADYLGEHAGDIQYTEFHYSTGADAHYFYTDAGVPLAASAQTGTASVDAGNRAGWDAANRAAANFVGVTRFVMNQRYNQAFNVVDADAQLPESAEQELQQQQRRQQREQQERERNEKRREEQVKSGMVTKSGMLVPARFRKRALPQGTNQGQKGQKTGEKTLDDEIREKEREDAETRERLENEVPVPSEHETAKKGFDGPPKRDDDPGKGGGGLYGGLPSSVSVGGPGSDS